MPAAPASPELHPRSETVTDISAVAATFEYFRADRCRLRPEVVTEALNVVRLRDVASRLEAGEEPDAMMVARLVAVVHDLGVQPERNPTP